MVKSVKIESISSTPRGNSFVQKIFETTLEQLAERGFDRISIPEIASLAAVNKTSIYRRWTDKGALVQAALIAAMQHTQEEPDSGNLQGDLIRLARNMATFAQTRVGKAIFSIVLTQGGNPQLQGITSAVQISTARGPWKVIERAIARGELPTSTSPSLILFTLAGAIMHRISVERISVTDEFIADLVRLVLFGATFQAK